MTPFVMVLRPRKASPWTKISTHFPILWAASFDKEDHVMRLTFSFILGVKIFNISSAKVAKFNFWSSYPNEKKTCAYFHRLFMPNNQNIQVTRAEHEVLKIVWDPYLEQLPDTPNWEWQEKNTHRYTRFYRVLWYFWFFHIYKAFPIW